MKKITAIIAALLFFCSCTSDNKPYKERSIGGSGEILLVTQNDEQFKGEIGKTVRDFFEIPMYGLPQPEPTFKVAHVNKNGFEGMFQKHRNIIMFEVDKNLEKPMVEYSEDWKAAPQFVMKIKASTEQAATNIFERRKDELKERFEANERERFQTFFRATAEKNVMKKLNDKFNISMIIPEGYMVAVDAADFLWLRKETQFMSYGMFIYQRPYVSEGDIDTLSLVNARNAYLMQYVPGPTDGSYMTTDTNFITPRFRIIPDFPAGYAVEMRGLWKVEGDFMGGPYVSYTVVNPTHDKLITVEGFIYYPNKKKRDFIRQHESVLRTLKFI